MRNIESRKVISLWKLLPALHFHFFEWHFFSTFHSWWRVFIDSLSLLYNSPKRIYLSVTSISVLFNNPTLDYQWKQNEFCDSRVVVSSLQLWKVKLSLNFLAEMKRWRNFTHDSLHAKEWDTRIFFCVKRYLFHSSFLII